MVNTRSGSSADGYQPITSSQSRSNLEERLSGATATIDSIMPMLHALKPSTDFERGLVDVVKLLSAQLRELKFEHCKLSDDYSFRNREYANNFDKLTLSCVKTEQYSRRDTVTVVGLSKPEGESQSDLCSKVAAALSVSGETVTSSDLSACHRNSNKPRTVRGKVIPPSVTVRFCTINQKDNVLKRYRNYDVVKKQSRDVRVYQSLSYHYSDLRGSIVDFFKLSASEAEQKYGFSNNSMKLKWCTYQSPTAGFAVKLANDVYFNRVHVWHEFAKNFMDNMK